MIRPFTCICMLMAAGSGLYLYQTKHRAQLLDREITRTLKQIDAVKERSGALKGEWAVMSEPDRLAELAQQHLSLRTLAPTQFAALADLATRLPAPLPSWTAVQPSADPQPAASPALPPAAMPPGPKPAPIIAAAPKLPAQPAAPSPAPGLQVAALTSPPTVTRAPPPRPAPSISAPATSLVALQPPPRATAPLTIGESVARASRLAAALPTPMQAVAQPIVSRMTPTSASVVSGYASGAVALAANQVSALGGAGRIALPAPVPYGTALSAAR